MDRIRPCGPSQICSESVSSRTSVVGLMLLACAFNAASADLKAEYDRRNAERYVELFTTLDRNRDGAVSLGEAWGDVYFLPRLDDIDINCVGLITGPELQRFVHQEHGVRVELTPPRNEGQRR